MKVIAIDAMGGDFGAKVVVPGSIDVLNTAKDIKIILVGDEKIIKSHISQHALRKFSHRIDIYHTDEEVLMTDLPSVALRKKKNSSMRVAVNLIKERKADACVSAGNTGALMAISHFVLKTLPGIDRAAIISKLPTLAKQCRVLDLGANVDSCAEHLVQFAIMGSVLCQAIDKIENPTVGLLNIGVEEIKGNDQVKRTAQLLAECKSVNYIGYVEGNDISKGTADVIVCDGFVGNVALKSSEGMARLLLHTLNIHLRKNIFLSVLGLAIKPFFNHVIKKLDPSRYNGATFVGLNGVVIKSHGSTNKLGFKNAVFEAINEINSNVPGLIAEKTNEFASI